MLAKDRNTIIAVIGASVLIYKVVSRLWSYFRYRSHDLIPVGVVKELYVYPIKSCKGISVFSFFCHRLGPVSGENFDRYFIVICGKTGRFYTARQKPVMVTISCDIRDGILSISWKDESAHVDIEKVRKEKIVRTAVSVAVISLASVE